MVLIIFLNYADDRIKNKIKLNVVLNTAAAVLPITGVSQETDGESNFNVSCLCST